MRRKLLTPLLHQQLITEGYKYLLIEDVSTDKDLSSMLVNPVLSIPVGSIYSCTGIEDGMITSLVNGKTDHFKIYYFPFVCI